MSLTVQVAASGPAGEERVATLIVRRMSGTTDEGSWGTYHYTIAQHLAGDTAVIARGDVRHRYGDGALRLIRRVMEAADL